MHRNAKLGLGTAHKLAFQYARENNYSVLVTLDADHSHNPSDIPRLIEKLDNFDFAIGSRYVSGGSCSYRGYRNFISRLANFVARMLLGILLENVQLLLGHLIEPPSMKCVNDVS